MMPSRVKHALSIVGCAAPNDWDDERAEELALAESAEGSLVLDEDAWEDAVDESGIDCKMLCQSQWRSSTVGSRLIED
jgi:hypothetical protein